MMPPMAKQMRVDSERALRRGADCDISLGKRAAIAARAELRGERTGILGAIGEASPLPLARPRRLPNTWTFLHVMERMEEAFCVLGRLAAREIDRFDLTNDPRVTLTSLKLTIILAVVLDEVDRTPGMTP